MGLLVLLFSVVLTIRVYMPCPFWDQWTDIAAFADGKAPSWHWLWSPNNEHRIVIPHLFIWADFALFRTRNISLFVEIFAVQVLHWSVLAYVIERFTELPLALRRTLQGLFLFCLFHPNQADNFTWAYQISFVVPFFAASISLLAVAFYRRICSESACLAIVALAPVVGAFSLLSGLFIGPASALLALVKRLPARMVLTPLAVTILLAIPYYAEFHWHTPGVPPVPPAPHLNDVFEFLLKLLSSSWGNFLMNPTWWSLCWWIALLSLFFFLGLLVLHLCYRKQTSDFEWFLLAEAGLMLFVSAVTSYGRVHFGLWLAVASRYQTPAMLYWCSLMSLSLMILWRKWPRASGVPQAAMALIMAAYFFAFPRFWKDEIRLLDPRRFACRALIRNGYDEANARKLYILTPVVQKALPFWLKARSGK